jgi:LAO/AO transport system kinase
LYDRAVRVPTSSEILSGDRSALARAITLVESTRPDHAAAATALLDELLPYTGRSKRIGVSGTPGVGKSTFIEALGTHLTERGDRVAVLAIDPSSQRTGGSILGDRTRMTTLSRDPNAFIRSTPSSGVLGGVGAQSAAARLLCEAAGHTVVLIETVGVGQSETAVGDLTDLFLLLVAPAGGDDLQGIKRGVMEMADLIVINKADGSTMDAAKNTQNDYRAALSLVRPKWPGNPTDVMLCSALERHGVVEVWDRVEQLWHQLEGTGALDSLRRDQAAASFRRHINDGLFDVVMHRGDTQAGGIDVPALETSVREGIVSPISAARQVIDAVASRL